MSTTTRHLTKQEFSPEEERAFRWFVDEYGDAIEPLRDEIQAAVREADLSSLSSIRAEVERRVGTYTSDIEVVFSEGTERGAEAGRRLAVRRHSLDVSFDVPDRALNELDDWVSEATGEHLETITDDISQYIRGAHEEGLSIPDLSEQINSELFDDRLEDHVAERAARTTTVGSSNAGSHSAYEEADSVVAEEWVTEIDGREREAHADAHGQVVAVDTPFLVDGEALDHPGAPAGSAGNVINCRCTSVPVFADQLTASQLEAIEAGERIYV